MQLFKQKPLKIQTKLSYPEFENWYLSHPGFSPQEIADEFKVSVRTAYNKIEIFNKRNGAKVDIRLSSMQLDAYKEGYDMGVVVGAAIGGLTADLLKSNGIGISDLVAWIAKSIKGNNGKTQAPNETRTQTP